MVEPGNVHKLILKENINTLEKVSKQFLPVN